MISTNKDNFFDLSDWKKQIVEVIWGDLARVCVQ